MTHREPTIFDKIIDGEIPCHRVYEDAHVLSFLDIGPLSYGHTLVIPKQRVSYLHELTDDAAAALGRVLPRLCRAVMQATGAEAYNVVLNTGSTAGQAVLHPHFHIIPGDRGWHVDDDPDRGVHAEEVDRREAIRTVLYWAPQSVAEGPCSMGFHSINWEVTSDGLSF
jgi:histidine triad (HIT) family protein